MCSFSFFLIALLAFNLADDGLVPGPGSLSAPLADDDNNYLPPKREDVQRWSSHQKPVFAALKHQAHDFFFSPGTWPLAESNGAASFAPPPLYVLMSLQI